MIAVDQRGSGWKRAAMQPQPLGGAMDRTYLFKLALLGVLVTLTVVTTARVDPPAVVSAAADVDALAAEMLVCLNGERSATGVPTLMLSDEASLVALARSRDMVAAGYFAHVSPSGIDLARLLAEHGVAYRLMGENIARSGHPAGSVIGVICSTLMASDAHRLNMLDTDFTRVGIGIAAGDGLLYVTLVFLD